ncbi:hypothetical protein PO124_18830 [Bacillus licheniformis]|nr:hypothetical protein [Bacillus licheniformis]
MAYIYVTDQNTPLQDAVNELKKTDGSLSQRGKRRLDIRRFEAFLKTAAVSSARRLSRSLRAVMDDQRRFSLLDIKRTVHRSCMAITRMLLPACTAPCIRIADGL